MINLGSAYGEIQIGTGDAEKSVQGLADKLRGIGGAMSLAITTPLVGIATAAGMATAEFEQSMNTMQVVSGATAQEMAALQQEALRLGAETSFSAGEAAQGMLELAKAGLSTEQVMAAIGGTLDLAAAGGLGVGQAAEIAANAVNTFGLEASDTTRVADMLAAAANASSVEVTDMAQGMQMAGAVFAANKVPVEDLSTAIALLGNNGIQGSDAGTSLKTMLMRLTAPTDDAAAVMRNLGIEVYNADGTMREFPDILASMEQAMFGVNQRTVTTSNLTADQAERMDYLKKTIEKTERKLADYASGLAGVAQSEEDKVVAVDRLNRELAAARGEFEALAGVGGTTQTVMQQLTEEERNMALTTLFGADAIRAANVLLAEGATGYSDMKAQVIEAGAAGEVADSKLKGLAGAIEYAKGSIESALITAFLPFTDAVGGLIRQAADLVTAFVALPDPIKNATLAFAAVLAVAGPVMVAISGIGAVLGFLLSPIGLIVVGVAALAAAWASNFMGIQEATAAAWAVIGPVLGQVVDGFSNYAQSVMDAGFGSSEAAESISLLPAALQPVALAFDSIAAAVSGWIGSLSAVNVSVAESSTMYAAFKNQIAEALAGVQAAWDALLQLLAPALERLQAAFATAGTQVAGLAPHFEGLLLAVQNMWVALQPILEAFGQLIGAVVAVASVLAVNLLAQAFTNFGTVAGAVLDQITLTINTFAALITQVVTLVTALVAGDWQTAWSSAQSIVGIFEGYFTGTFENLRTIATTMITAITKAVTDTLSDMGVDTEGIMTGISAWWTSMWDGLTQKVQPVIDMVSEFRKALEGFAEWVSGFSIPNPFDGWSMPSLPWGGPAAPPGQNARGTNWWPGGLSWVGERGPELVDLPRGARVYDAQTSQGMAGRTFNINVPVQNLGSQLDMVELAHRVAGVIMQYEGA